MTDFIHVDVQEHVIPVAFSCLQISQVLYLSGSTMFISMFCLKFVLVFTEANIVEHPLLSTLYLDSREQGIIQNLSEWEYVMRGPSLGLSKSLCIIM